MSASRWARAVCRDRGSESGAVILLDDISRGPRRADRAGHGAQLLQSIWLKVALSISLMLSASLLLGVIPATLGARSRRVDLATILNALSTIRPRRDSQPTVRSPLMRVTASSARH
jgi:hypothetical protein